MIDENIAGSICRIYQGIRTGIIGNVHELRFQFVSIYVIVDKTNFGPKLFNIL